MPLLDGFGLLKELRSDENTRTIPIILLSARAGEEFTIGGLEAGADGYLAKPFTAKKLMVQHSPIIAHHLNEILFMLTITLVLIQATVSSHLSMAKLRLESAQREHRLRQEVNDAKEQLEMILDSIGDAFINLDKHYQYTYANQNVIKMLGIQKEDLIGNPIWNLFDREDAVIRTALNNALHKGISVTFESFSSSLGHWYENRIYPSSDGNSASIFMADITLRKKAEERLEILSSVGLLLSECWDLKALLPEIAKLAVSHGLLANWCIVDLLSEDGKIQRISTEHAQRSLWQIKWHKHLSEKHNESSNKVKSNSTTILKFSLQERGFVEIHTELEDRSFVAFPIEARGKIFGIWVFAYTNHRYYQVHSLLFNLILRTSFKRKIVPNRKKILLLLKN